MKCPKCGHEVNQGEAFCGQCGASMMSSAPLATEMVQTPPRPGGTALFPPGTQLPQHNQPNNRTASFENASRINQELPPTHHQQTGFYQDATEALSAMQGVPRPTYPPPQGSYPGISPYNTQMQPLQTSGYIPQQTYGYPSGRMAVPPQQKSSPMILIVCICLVIALVATGGIAALYYMNGQTAQNPGTSTATVVPTPTPTPSPTPTPTPSPTPTVAATPAPDPGFLWCGPVCVTYGFMTQYPMNWQPGAPTNSPGIQFTNLEQPDQFAAFKAPGPANQPAEALVASDLQANFATQPGYTPPPANTTATIGGVTWIAATAYYNPTVGAPAPTPTPTPVVTPDPAATATPVATPADPGIPPGQGDPAAKVRVVVYATVYQNKAYIIELQALDAQFDTVYAQAFNTMLTKFQFLPANPTP